MSSLGVHHSPLWNYNAFAKPLHELRNTSARVNNVGFSPDPNLIPPGSAAAFQAHIDMHKPSYSQNIPTTVSVPPGFSSVFPSLTPIYNGPSSQISSYQTGSPIHRTGFGPHQDAFLSNQRTLHSQPGWVMERANHLIPHPQYNLQGNQILQSPLVGQTDIRYHQMVQHNINNHRSFNTESSFDADLAAIASGSYQSRSTTSHSVSNPIVPSSNTFEEHDYKISKLAYGDCPNCLLQPTHQTAPCGCHLCGDCSRELEQIQQVCLLETSQIRCKKCNMQITRILKLKTAASDYVTVSGMSAYIDKGAHLSSLEIPRSSTRTPLGVPQSSLEDIISINTVEDAWEWMPLIELGTTTTGGWSGRGLGGEGGEWGVVKIENIPYNLTEEMLFEFIGQNIGLIPQEFGGGIHIIMDRTTGKTMDCFLEFISPVAAQRLIARRTGSGRRCILGGRHVTMEVVGMEVLMKWLFPKAKGIEWLRGGSVRALNRDNQDTKIEIVSREELVMILSHARTPHRSPFSRKCLQRPYESLLSIMSKFPWYATDLYNISQRDLLFQAVYDATDLLQRSIKKGRDVPNLNASLLNRMYQVSLECRGFTDTQRKQLLLLSNPQMPEDQEVNLSNWPTDFTLGDGFQALGIREGIETQVAKVFLDLIVKGTNIMKVEQKDFEDKAFMNSTSIGTTRSQADNMYHIDSIPASPVAYQHAKLTPIVNIDTNMSLKEAAVKEWAAVEFALRRVLPSKSDVEFIHEMDQDGHPYRGE